MMLKGTNLGSVEAGKKRISEFNFTNDEDLKRRIIMLEQLYYVLFEEVEKSEIKPMTIDETNHVIIEKRMINHRCNSDLSTLENIAIHGVLASEWFGHLESEREACFCAFVSKMKETTFPFRGDLSEDNYSRLNVGKDVVLFFDGTNSVMKYLLHLDYFEFEHIKSLDPKSINQKYSKEEIDLLEGLIEPLSPAGKNMRQNYDYKTNYWSAIPGGIPSLLINGICIKNNSYTDEELDRISCLFPSATIFNSKQEIVRYPIKYKPINN